MIHDMISIIVPVYNVEKYLPKCIDSIVNQTYKNIEILLIDDGSTDTSGKICDEYAKKDGRIIVIHKENGGQGSARNVALKIAKGEYIGFVDSDDCIDTDMYESLISALKKYDAEISMCAVKYINKDIITPIYETDSIQIMDTFETLKEYFVGKILQPAVWNKLYKRELWNNEYFPEIFREDIFVTYKLLKKAKKTVHIGDCKYNYLIRENSSEHQKYSEKFYNSIKALNIQYDELIVDFPELKDYIIDVGIAERIRQIKHIIKSHNTSKYKKLLDDMKLYLLEYPTNNQYLSVQVDEILNNWNYFCFKTLILSILPDNFIKFVVKFFRRK